MNLELVKNLRGIEIRIVAGFGIAQRIDVDPVRAGAIAEAFRLAAMPGTLGVTKISIDDGQVQDVIHDWGQE